MAYGKWHIAGYDRADAVKLCHNGVNPLLAVVLASRKILDEDEIRLLMSGDISSISDPMLLKDMDKAVARVRRAISEREHVAVYGDYDVDGITSSCLMAEYLRSKGLECEIYIPERLEEGYGVKAAPLKALKDAGVSLVITVDCGVTAVEEAEYAKDIGIDLIITDHHECCGILPDAEAVVDPKRPDCPSTAKALAGVGVAFKLACAVEAAEDPRYMLDRYGDLVAIGTIADVMPVVGENRILIRNGLESVKAGKRLGIGRLRAAAGVSDKRVSVSTVGFALAPRINAAGRLGNTDTAVNLLMAKDENTATNFAEELCSLNCERQRLEGEMFSSALKMLEGSAPTAGPIVLASDEWHQGVAGIVASKITEKFGVPSVMICVKDGVGRGSCRSCGDFNIFEALQSVKKYLLSFGGHDMAAGLTIDAGKINEFRNALSEYYASVPETDGPSTLNIDFEVIKPEILSVKNIDMLGALEPYGTGNPQPVLCLNDTVVESVMPLSEGKHTKLWASKCGELFEAVFFGKGAAELGVEQGIKADLAFIPQVNEFRGRRTVQLYLVDVKVHNC